MFYRVFSFFFFLGGGGQINITKCESIFVVQIVFSSKRLCTLGKLFGLAPGETTLSTLEKEVRVSSIIAKHILLPFVEVMHSALFDQ